MVCLAFALGCAPGVIDETSGGDAAAPVAAGSGGIVVSPPPRGARCEVGEYYLGAVTGALHDEADRPLAGANVTVCGTTCFAGQTGRDGRFEVRVEQCFSGSSEYAHGAAFSHEGLGRYADLFVDINPQDLSAMGTVRFERPLRAISLARGGAAPPGARADAPVTMVDGLGFALRFTPSSVSFPLSADDETVRAVRVPVALLPPYEGRPPVVAYAISPAGAELSTPARVEFPNLTGLRPRATVDIVAVGNHSSYGRPPVGVLERVDVGYVSDDGLRVIAANGLRFFGTVGYREASR